MEVFGFSRATKAVRETEGTDSPALNPRTPHTLVERARDGVAKAVTNGVSSGSTEGLSWQDAQRLSLARVAAAQARTAEEAAADMAAADALHSGTNGYDSILSSQVGRDDSLAIAFEQNQQLARECAWEEQIEAEIEAELNAFRAQAGFK